MTMNVDTKAAPVPARKPSVSLLVDDDPLASTFVRVLMERRGWRVEMVPTLAEAKRWLREAGAGTNGRSLPDLVLLDVNLRDGLGLDLAHWIKSSGVLGSLRVYVISADDTSANRQAALDAGADRFISKTNLPREIEQLNAA